MSRNAARTEPFVNFDDDLTQAVLIASLLSEAGIAALNELKDFVSSLTQRVAGVDLETLANMSEKERMKASMGATRADAAKMKALEKRATDYKHVGLKTAPSVILVYTVAKFESYLVDLALAIASSRPQLVGLTAGASEEAAQRKVSNLLDNKKMQDIGKVFQDDLKLPIHGACSKAKTSLQELDKARAIRHIHIHNRGYVNRRNRDRIDPALQIGSYYELSIGYLNEIKDKMYFTALDLDREAARRYPELVTT